MSRFILFILFVVTACTDPVEPPLVDCATWERCEGGLVATTTVLNAFGHASGTKYLPGDTMLLRITIENRATIPTDSIVVAYGAAGIGETRYSPPFVLAPRGVREILDTAIVTYTFGEPPEMTFEAWRYSPEPYFDIAVTRRGTTSLDIARSGFNFDLQPLPGPQDTFEYFGAMRVGVRVRHSDTMMISARITNVYETNLPPISLAGCVWEYDHCFDPFESTDSSPILKPGASADVTMAIVPDADAVYFDWFTQTKFAVDVCAEEMFTDMPCESAHILVVANFEKDCNVGSAVVGVLMTDTDPECMPRDDGSAYRFTARQGERYRVSSPDATVFIAPADGVPDYFTRPREVTIPSDGTYYVVLLHDSTASFLLQRIE